VTIWFATGNEHKRAELAAILRAGGCGRELRIPRDAGLDFAPDETESSFHGNALLKAMALRGLLLASRADGFSDGDPVIADDSGICVDALGGRPGLHSAMYAGPPGAELPDALGLEAGERNALLLGELGESPMRSARFVCAMALVLSPERFFVAQETLEGEIVRSARFAVGSGGFGYDPIFFVPALGRTVAELSEDEKNIISHRGKAGARVAGILKGLGIGD